MSTMCFQRFSSFRRSGAITALSFLLLAGFCRLAASEAGSALPPGVDRVEMISAATLSPGGLLKLRASWSSKANSLATDVGFVFCDPNGAERSVDCVKSGILADRVEVAGLGVVTADWTDGVYTLLRVTVGDASGRRMTYHPDGTLTSEPSMPTLPGKHSLALNELRFSVTGGAASPVTLTRQPQSQAVAQGEAALLDCAATSLRALTFQWRRNGRPLAGAQAATLTAGALQPTDTGLYTADVGADGNVTRSTEPALLGLSTTRKVIGAGFELHADIRHPNGNVFDQVALTGAAESITADFSQKQITRTSFVDLDGDIVQVEFSGPGTLSLVLEGAGDPTAAANYNQPGVHYVKGHAGITIVGATEQTNVSVFSVGTTTAVNQSLFKADVAYDGIADIAFIAILSANGKFGGLWTANANYQAYAGHTGIYAPGVEFAGPVYVGDITAFDSAKPVLVLGSANDVRITGGDLWQNNQQPVQVDGIARLQFTAGSNSHGRELSAQPNQAVLLRDRQDVTAQVVAQP